MKKKAWLPIKKLQQKDSGATTSSLSMEQPKNKIHPSLPANYVTLAQLQERWLKQKNQQKQEEEKQQNQKQPEEKEETQVPVAVAVAAPTNVTVSRSHPTAERQQEEKRVPVAVVVVAPTNGTVSRSPPVREQHRRKNRIGWSIKRSMEETTSGNRRKLEKGGEIGENRPKSGRGSGIGENRPKSEIGELEEEKHVSVAVADVAPTNVTISRSHPAPERRRRKNWNRKNWNDSGDKRRTDDAASGNRRKLENGAGTEENRLISEIGAEIRENRLKSEIGDGIGDENANLNGELKGKKKKKWKKKWKGKMKPKVEEEKGGTENGTAERENEVAEKMKPKVEEEKGGIENDIAEPENEVAEKTTIESELNDEKNVDSITVEKVEEKFGDLSMNPRNGKQNLKFRRVNNGFRQSQFQSNYRGGGYGYGPFRDQRRFNNQRRFNSSPMIWVKKDGFVGEIEP